MKIYKIALINTVILFLSAYYVFAKPVNADPDKMAAKQTEIMRSRLKLNDKQTTYIKTINLKYAREAQNVFKAYTGNFVVARKKMDSLVIAKNNELKPVLTPIQWKTYNSIKASAFSY